MMVSGTYWTTKGEIWREKSHLVLDPEEKELREEDWVGDHIEGEETQERFREEPEKETVLIEIDAKYIFLT